MQKKKSSSVITQKSAKYHVLKKFSVLSGDLIDIGTWVADVSILTSFNDSTIYVERNGVAWLVDLSVKKSLMVFGSLILMVFTTFIWLKKYQT